MKNLFDKKHLKITCATSVAVFSLLVFFTSTFAWFTAIRSQNATASDIIIENDSKKFKSFSVYPLIQPEDADGNPIPLSATDTSYYFSKTAAGTCTYNYDTKEFETTGNLGINLGVYSLLDRDHPVLGIFEFYDEASNPSPEEPIMISCSTDYGFVGEVIPGEGDEVIFPNELQYEDNPLSSIINFQCIGMADLSGITNVRNLEITKESLETATYSSFVNFDDTYTEVIFDKNPTLFKATSGTVKYVCCVFNYNKEALEFIYGVYLGQEVIQGQVGDNTLDYFMDFSIRV